MPIRLPRRLSSTSDPARVNTTTNGANRILRKGMIEASASAPNMPVTSPCRMMTGSFHHPSPNHPRTLLSLPPSKMKPDPPLLLLKGDELHVSPQGVARSCYQLCGPSCATTAKTSIEERYNLCDSTKSFVVRTPVDNAISTAIIDIQEIDTRRAGTGGTTWEASIAMALFFASQPHQLRGKVVELGSGVGLGGILLHHLVSSSSSVHTSITLTDGNDQVLEQCRANVSRQGPSTLKTTKLDWNDIVQANSNLNDLDDAPSTNCYQTVLACDCAYRTQDVSGLAQTLKALLSKQDNNNGNSSCNKNLIHLFGPYNRAAYHEVIQWMENDPELDVQVDWIELQRFRLQASATTTPSSTNSNSQEKKGWPAAMMDATSVTDPFLLPPPSRYGLEDELKQASQSRTKFLHVTASYKKRQSLQDDNVSKQPSPSMTDID